MPEHYNAGDRMPEGVLLLDPTTGLPVPTPAQGPTLADCEAFCAGASLSSPITDTPTT